MPTAQCHLNLRGRTSQARAFLETRIGDFPEWVVTTAFYEALHCVEQYLALKNKHFHDHKERNQHLQRQFPALWSWYGFLYKESRVARYLEDDGRPYIQRMPAAQIQSIVVGTWLSNVKAECSRLSHGAVF